jgi:hypothetical protein
MFISGRIIPHPRPGLKTDLRLGAEFIRRLSSLKEEFINNRLTHVGAE